MLLSKCVIGGSKKPKFIKSQDGNGLLSSLEIKTPLKILTGKKLSQINLKRLQKVQICIFAQLVY